MITQQELKDLLHYDPNTGLFTWRVSLNTRIKEGQEAGCLNNLGYVKITIRRRRHSAHRLAWLYVYGHNPPQYIDHINGVCSDNRAVNLRLATHSENLANAKKRKNTVCHLKGVTLRGDGRYLARITVKNTQIYLGRYDTEQEAHAAYVAAAEKEFGAFARAE
jgi:hypothetical protein